MNWKVLHSKSIIEINRLLFKAYQAIYLHCIHICQHRENCTKWNGIFKKYHFRQISSFFMRNVSSIILSEQSGKIGLEDLAARKSKELKFHICAQAHIIESNILWSSARSLLFDSFWNQIAIIFFEVWEKSSQKGCGKLEFLRARMSKTCNNDNSGHSFG